MSDLDNEIPFAQQMNDRVAAEEKRVIKTKKLAAQLLLEVLCMDPQTLPPKIRSLQEALFKLNDS